MSDFTDESVLIAQDTSYKGLKAIRTFMQDWSLFSQNKSRALNWKKKLLMITWYVLFGMDVHQALKFPLQQILLSLKMVRSSGKPSRGSLSPSD